MVKFFMNILVTGASGFIASHIVTDLAAKGYTVIGCVRNVAYAKNILPQAKIIRCDFINDTKINDWIPRLKNIDLVINCVGILYHPNKKIIWAVHHDTPHALFDACVQSHVKRIIQISALGIDHSDTDYAKSKKAADDYLLTLPINATVLRPSLVYSHGSYGGTSLFRGLSALPYVMPMPGKGTQEFQPIHLQDLSKAILQLVQTPPKQSCILHAVSSQRICLREILTQLRRWLGFSSAMVFFIPLWLIRIASLFGDLIPYSAMNSSSYKMMMQNNVTGENEAKKFHTQIGFTPRDFVTGLYSSPSSVQDRWHARLYFCKPLLQLSISFVWILSGICSLFYATTHSYELLTKIGLPNVWQPIFLYSASLIDILLGFAMLIGYQLRKMGLLQIVFILIYTIIISWQLPYLWLEPFAPIAKNIPLLAAIGVFLALESAR